MTLFQSNDLVALGLEADALRRKLHPEGIVSYCIDSGAVSAVQLNAEDPLEYRLNQLEEFRDAQAVMPFFKQEVSAVEYLTMLAIARLYLDNVPHIQTSWTAGGLKLCQVALRFGANDICGSPESAPAEEELRRVIRDAGFSPKQRDALFRMYSLD